jgi:23S rRNA (pseudouridine1915-N3)-methyltransferase
MNIIIISPGKSKDYLSESIVNGYTSRISHYSNIDWKFIPTNEPKEEGEKILKAIPDNSYVVILDDKGKSQTSEEFADFLNKKMNESTKNLVFIIGGAYGIDERVREIVQEKPHLILSLSKFTFPHELVRGILAEQIYRGFSILKGEKYHHG